MAKKRKTKKPSLPLPQVQQEHLEVILDPKTVQTSASVEDLEALERALETAQEPHKHELDPLVAVAERILEGVDPGIGGDLRQLVKGVESGRLDRTVTPQEVVEAAQWGNAQLESLPKDQWSGQIVTISGNYQPKSLTRGNLRVEVLPRSVDQGLEPPFKPESIHIAPRASFAQITNDKGRWVLTKVWRGPILPPELVQCPLLGEPNLA